jgi:hypothetical protein
METTPYNLEYYHRRLGRTRCSNFSTLNIEAPGSPKRWYLSSKLHGVISDKNVILDSILVSDYFVLFGYRIDEFTKAICKLHSISFKVVRWSEGYRNPFTGLDRPLGFQEVEAPRFIDSRHMKVVRSALRTGRLYPTGNTHFC